MNWGISKILNWLSKGRVSKFFKGEHCKQDLPVAFVAGKIVVLLLLVSSLNSFGQVTIWEEDFESYTDNTGVEGAGIVNIGDYPSSVSKWTIDATGAELGNANDFLKVNSAYFQGSDVHGKGIWLSETIDISTYANVSVSGYFWKNDETMELTDSINFYYRIDGGTWNTIILLNDDISTSPQNYSVSNINGSSLEVKVEIINIGNKEIYAFDNIIVKGIPNSPPSCTAPISPANGETDFAVNGTLSWNLAAGTTSYEIYFGTDDPPTNIENGTDLGNVLSYTPDATLDPLTIYYWQIIPKNSNGSPIGCSVWSFTTEDISYCVSSGNMNNNNGVTLVNFNTIDNATGKPAGYNDYTSQSTNLTIGNSYNLTVNLNTGGNNTNDAMVWIDWNQDGDFSDTGEEFDMGDVKDVTDGATTNSPLSITIPASASLDSTRMRVSSKWKLSPTACETDFDGEVEDYTINICKNPDVPTLSFSANPVCEGDDVTLNITGSLNSATQWVIYTGTCGGTLVGTTTSSSYSLNNVTSSTTYYVRGEGSCVTPGSCGSMTVTVEDTEDPTITCAIPAPAYSNDGGECFYTVPDNSFDPTATDDNCAIALVINDFNSANTLNGAQLPVGTTTVIWTVTDAAGNTATCQYDVVVIDDENPTITCPTTVTVNPDDQNNGICTASGVDLGTPTTSDNCPGETTSNNAPATFPMGNTVVTWIVTDAAGNTATCQQTVTVEPATIIDIAVVDLGNSCQSGETGSTTTITWDVNLLQGSNTWTYDYIIKEGLTTLQSGTNVNATGNIQRDYSMDNATAVNKTYTITITNVKDNCGVAEINTANNSDSATMFGVPATSDISTN